MQKQSFRSSHPNVFCRKGVLKNSANFTRKYLCQNLVFNKIAGLRPAPFLKNRLWQRRFPVNFAKFLRAPFFIENLWWLLLVVTRVLQNGSFEKSRKILRKTQVPEFSFSKVPDSHPTALANPFLVLSWVLWTISEQLFWGTSRENYSQYWLSFLQN